MIRANLNRNLNDIQVEVKGSDEQVILEISLLLMNVKKLNKNTFDNILHSIKIITNLDESKISIDELIVMYISTYAERNNERKLNND